MINIHRLVYPFATALTVFLLAGCAAKSPPVDFFTLASHAGDTGTVEGAVNCQDKIIAVGPVSWPRYLDQPRIVTREGENKLEFNEFNRWAGSLQDNFNRTVNAELSGLLASDYITKFSRTSHIKPALRVEIDISEFEGQLGGDVSLAAKWAIIEQSSGKPLALRTTRLKQAASDATYQAQVMALNGMTRALSHEIATELADNACNQ